MKRQFAFFLVFVLLTVYLSIILDNDQLDTQLLYFTIRLLCFEHYMLIIRRLDCIDAASGIVTLCMGVLPSGVSSCEIYLASVWAVGAKHRSL